MIALHAAGSHQIIAALRQGVGHQKFQFARFVAAGRQAGLVVALDEQAWPAQMFAEAGHFFQRGGQVGDGHTIRVFGGHKLSTPPLCLHFLKR